MIGSAALSVVALLLLAETLKRDLSAKAYAPKAEVGLS
jgi:hypothetical protein